MASSELKKDLKGKFCIKPFNSMELHLEGEAFVCCPSWLKSSIGNVQRSQLEEIWNSQSAQAIRKSIVDGDYKYCDKEQCPYIQSGMLPSFQELPMNIQNAIIDEDYVLDFKPEQVMLSYERTCNLSCPSCRTELQINTPGSTEYNNAESFTQQVYDYFILNLNQDKMVLNITGSGDPFASVIFRKLLGKIDGNKYPNLLIDLQTNGILLTSLMWDRLSNIKNNINQICVSIDAATEETYLKVRRGGHWPVLLENMRFLSTLRKQKKINLLIARFVVQKSNFREMNKFTDLFLEIGADVVDFSILSDWGTWSSAEFKNQCVWNSQHPDYHEFLLLLSKRSMGHQRVFLGNLTPYRKIAQDYCLNTLRFDQKIIYKIKNGLQGIVNAGLRKKFAFSKKISSLLK